jgi:leader peptidase (prepilin peptidase) / N-methyltransferase
MMGLMILTAPVLGYLGQLVVRRFHAAASPWSWLWLAIAGVCLTLWASTVMPPGPLLWASLLLAWALLWLSAIDLAVYRLPDVLTLPLIGAGLLVSYYILPGPPILDHAIGAAFGFALLWLLSVGFRKLRGRDGLGLGDAKLTAAAGAWLGWADLPSVLLIASLCGLLIYALIGLIRGRSALSVPIAFGGPLALAIWLVWLYDPLETMFSY